MSLADYVTMRGAVGFAPDLAKRREVVWLSKEEPGVVGEIAALVPALSELRFLLGRT